MRSMKGEQKKEAVFSALDLGASKVLCLVAASTGDGLRLLAAAQTPSQGLSKGNVVDQEGLCRAIRTVKAEAELQAGQPVPPTWVSVGGPFLSSWNKSVCLTLSRPEAVVLAGDVRRALQQANGVSRDIYRVLHVIPRYYSVDGERTARSPVGRPGLLLEVEAHVVAGDGPPLQKVCEAVEAAGLRLRGLVASPLASAEAALTSKEKEAGVILLDLGAGCTGVALFYQGQPWHTGVVPLGGEDLNRDLVTSLGLPPSVVERVKQDLGHVLPSEVSPRETLGAPGLGGPGQRQVLRRDLCQVLQTKVRQILARALGGVGEAGWQDPIPAGLVLTGGTAQLPGISVLVREIYRVPARVGLPQALPGAEHLEDPAHSSSLGLLLWAARAEATWREDSLRWWVRHALGARLSQLKEVVKAKGEALRLGIGI